MPFAHPRGDQRNQDREGRDPDWPVGERDAAGEDGDACQSSPATASAGRSCVWAGVLTGPLSRA